jgi:hypothetical protein
MFTEYISTMPVLEKAMALPQSSSSISQSCQPFKKILSIFGL